MLKKYKALLIAIAIGLASFAVVYSITPQTQTKQAAQYSLTMINLLANKASPDQAVVKVGQTIQFNSRDGKNHNLSLGEGHDHDHSAGTYQSGLFKADEAWKVTFKEPGTFTFHDEENPNISIIVVAYNP